MTILHTRSDSQFTEHLSSALRISSGVGEGIYKPVVQRDREFLCIGVGDGQ